MKINNLSTLPFEKVVEVFLKAFQNYFVPLPTDVDYWKNRFAAVKVDWELSFGMFEGDDLVGYIINAIGNHNGKLTAYNTGTGVLEEFRGRQIVDDLYEHAFPVFRKRGIEKCLLEVICENKRAIKVYERIGFEKLRQLSSFAGTISTEDAEILVEKTDYREVINLGLYRPQLYSWESSAETVLNSGDAVHTYVLKNGKEHICGYFCIDKNDTVLQLDNKEITTSALLYGISKVSKNVKIKNVSEEREELISALISAGMENKVNQYEMQLFL